MRDRTTVKDLVIEQYTRKWRFGEDSVLLADFCIEVETRYFRHKSKKLVLDIGSGSGIISLLLKRSFPDSHVVAVDIDPEFAKLTASNSKLNRLPLSVVCADIKRYPFGKRFDIIVSNPPYLDPRSGKISPEKAIAKWEITLDLPSLAKACSALARGRVYVAYPAFRLREVLEEFEKRALKPAFIRFFHHSLTSQADVFFLCCEFSSSRKLEVLPPYIREKPHPRET